MPGVENYQRNPADGLISVLYVLGWKLFGSSLWQKGQARLYVDSVGVFLYRQVNGAWVRTHGLAHNLIRPQTRRIVFKDLLVLDLVTGEWNEPDQN